MMGKNPSDSELMNSAPQAQRKETSMTTISFVHGVRSADFDLDGINQMVCAIQMEMGSTPGECTRSTNVLFMGGPDLTQSDEDALARYALDVNWYILFPVFDTATPAAGPLEVRVVVTDGGTTSLIMKNGRLWKRDLASPTIVVFPDGPSSLRVNSKGKLLLRPTNVPYHDHGYDLARESLAVRASTEPGKVPMVTPIGRFVTVMEARSLAMMLEMA